MKILLVGEYSGFHNNLKAGLINLGHEVRIVSFSDGFKNIPVDDSLDVKNLSPCGVVNSFYIRLNLLRFLWQVYNTRYDVIQLVNAHYLDFSFFPSRLAVLILKWSTDRLYLSACGTDAVYVHNAPTRLPYNMFKDVDSFDNDKRFDYYKTNKALSYNKFVVRQVEGIIPTSLDYALPYNGQSKLCREIQLPVDITLYRNSSVVNKKKLIVFHPLNRYGFKGTRFIEDAFEYLSKEFSNEVSFVIRGKMPMSDYLNLLQAAHIVVDQVYSLGIGMNAAISLSLGKVVISGNEYGTLLHSESPVINIRPDLDCIISVIREAIRNYNAESSPKRSRKFAEQYLDSKLVADRYMQQWIS